MEKIAAILTILLLSVQASLASEIFCGRSTFAPCLSNSDCKIGGCSGQVCEGKDERSITTCEWKDCYNAEKYNLTCQCINNKCQWGYPDQTPFAVENKDKFEVFLGLLSSVNPLIFLVLGILLIIAAKLAKFLGMILLILGLLGILLWFFAH
jgi:eight-cysteine-cluster-containing protein